jgi:sterol desaturase/sphingolipid hydroxylase (fatty acid hydroxylase superfamily)
VANPAEQKQTRWVLFGMGAMAVFILSILAYTAILGDTTIGTPADPDFFRRFVFLSVLNLSFEFIYLSIGMAILRSQLFDIDVIIRKTLVYTALTALLALVYFGSVVLLQRLFGTLTGVAQSPLAVVVSTLVIAALFTPLRRRIQDAIDRRFFRKKYDAQRVLAHFAQTARDETDLDALTGELARVVQETLQPEQVSVWVRK